MIKTKLLTEKAFEVIAKKLRNNKLTQQDSNYLSRFVRPKLREISLIDAKALLNRLNYNPKAMSLERKIKKIIINNIPSVDSIILCGSAVQTNYKEYNDIDVIVATKKIISKSIKKKRELIADIEELGKKDGVILDVQIYAKKSILSQYPHNLSLIYQLKDSKIIHGDLQIPKKIKLSNLDLKMKLDWSEGLTAHSNASEIYYAIRNAMLVLLIMHKKVDNSQLKMNLLYGLGADLLANLRNNQASNIEKKLALSHLNLLLRHLENELSKSQWEKIEFETH